MLVLISNKRNADEVDLDIQRTSEAFSRSMGPDMAMLDCYFSCVICCQLPNRRGVVTDESGATHDGAALFATQIRKLRMLLASLMRSRQLNKDAAGGSGSQGSRLMTSRHGLWFTLLPRVVQLVNAGLPVHVSRLVDEAWLEQLTQLDGKADAPFDIL